MENLLKLCLEKDNESRKLAEEKLKSVRESHPEEFVEEAAEELTNGSRSEYTRELAGLMFQTIVRSRNPETKETPWETLPAKARANLRDAIMEALGTDNANVRKGASTAIAAIACFELAQEEGWPDLIDALVAGLKSENFHFKQSAIQTVGKICEDVKPSLIRVEQGKLLFETLTDQLFTEDFRLKCIVLDALLVMIPFASFRLAKNEDFAMGITQAVFQLVRHGPSDDDPEYQLQEHAWKCMTELAHYFYLAFYDKATTVLDVAFTVTEIGEKSPARQLLFFEKCGMLAMETISILIQVELDRKRRGLQSFNIVMEVAHALCKELIKTLNRLNQAAFALDAVQDEIFEHTFPAAETALERLIRLVALVDLDSCHKTIGLIREGFTRSLDEPNTTAAGIAMISCCFVAEEPELTASILRQGFDTFLEYLASDKLFVVERMMRLFENAFETHWQILIADRKYADRLVEVCVRAFERPFCFAELYTRIAQKLVLATYRMQIYPPHIVQRLLTFFFDVMTEQSVNVKQIAINQMASNGLVKMISVMQKHEDGRALVQTQVLPHLTDQLYESMHALEQLSPVQLYIQDFLMEGIAEALLVVPRITSEQFSRLVQWVGDIFQARGEVSGEGLLLYNSTLHCVISDAEGYAVDQLYFKSANELTKFIQLAVVNFYGSKVATDALICVSSMAMRLRLESHKFFETLVSPLPQLIRDADPRNHDFLYMAISTYSDCAFYSQALFKPYVDEFIKTLNFVANQVVKYWNEKEESDGECAFQEHDEDDKMCLHLIEALVEAYHNTAMAAEQGKWRGKLSGFMLEVLEFFEMALAKMGTIMSPTLKADMGFAFADILRTMRDVVYNWFHDHLDWFRKFTRHLREELHTLKTKAEQGKGPNDLELFQNMEAADRVLHDWFGKMNMAL